MYCVQGLRVRREGDRILGTCSWALALHHSLAHSMEGAHKNTSSMHPRVGNFGLIWQHFPSSPHFKEHLEHLIKGQAPQHLAKNLPVS